MKGRSATKVEVEVGLLLKDGSDDENADTDAAANATMSELLSFMAALAFMEDKRCNKFVTGDRWGDGMKLSLQCKPVPARRDIWSTIVSHILQCNK